LGGETLIVTPIHRFWQASKGWVMARTLKPGDAIRAVGGLVKVVASNADEACLVYNLEVAENHSFFVGQSQALVHDHSLVASKGTCFDAQPNLAAITRSAEAAPQAESSARGWTPDLLRDVDDR
jgi:hypothetical protein